MFAAAEGCFHRGLFAESLELCAKPSEHGEGGLSLIKRNQLRVMCLFHMTKYQSCWELVEASLALIKRELQQSLLFEHGQSASPVDEPSASAVEPARQLICCFLFFVAQGTLTLYVMKPKQHARRCGELKRYFRFLLKHNLPPPHLVSKEQCNSCGLGAVNWRAELSRTHLVPFTYASMVVKLRTPILAPTPHMLRGEKHSRDKAARQELGGGATASPLSLPEAQATPRVLVFGDSHTIPLAWQWMNVGGRWLQLEPALTVGAKAWHMAALSSSVEQAGSREERIVVHQSYKIPGRCFVIASAGEIDCRIPEGGIWQALRKGKYANLQQAIEKTVQRYLSGLFCLAQRKNALIAIHPVRPPFLPESRVKKAKHYKERQWKQAMRALIVRNFNEAVQRQLNTKSFLGKEASDASTQPSGCFDLHFLDFYEDMCEPGQKEVVSPAGIPNPESSDFNQPSAPAAVPLPAQLPGRASSEGSLEWVSQQMVQEGMRPPKQQAPEDDEKEHKEEQAGEGFNFPVPPSEMTRASRSFGRNGFSLEGMHCNANYCPLLKLRFEQLFENVLRRSSCWSACSATASSSSSKPGQAMGSSNHALDKEEPAAT